MLFKLKIIQFSPNNMNNKDMQKILIYKNKIIMQIQIKKNKKLKLNMIIKIQKSFQKEKI